MTGAGVAAAVLAVVLLAIIAAFQIALALGSPLGVAAWGGQHPGRLPSRLRVASAITGLAVYPLLAATVLAAAGIITDAWLPIDTTVLIWALAALLAVGALMNFASCSRHERLWGPVALTIAMCCGIVALRL